MGNFVLCIALFAVIISTINASALDKDVDSIVSFSPNYDVDKAFSAVSGESKYPKKTMELLFVGDFKFVEFHGKDYAPEYLLKIANIMASTFQDASLDYPIDIVVTRTILFDKDVFNAKSTGNYLTRFRQWFPTINVLDDADPNHFDAAVLFTRRGGCEDGCGGIGYAVDQSCGTESVAVVRDDGLIATALAAAHEVAHILNADHDGPPENSKCKNGVNIMSSGGREGGRTSYQWSKCTSDSIKYTLLSSRSNCYNDKPTKVLGNSTTQLYGLGYSRDKQCEMIEGKGYIGCTVDQCKKNGELRCDEMRCITKGASMVQLAFFPFLHGTTCGLNKWCIYGECIPVGATALKPVDGQWGAWGDYEACSRTCEVGVQSKYRECIGTKNGGKFCEGGTPGERQAGFTKPCKVRDDSCASSNMNSDRDTQCLAKTNNQFKHCTKCHHHAEKKPCNLFCGDRSIYDKGMAEDGTECHTKHILHGICVKNICKIMFCDNTMDSGAETDRCFKCGGDGTTCKEIKGTSPTVKVLRKEHHIVTIPVGAWRIRVKKDHRDPMFMSFKLGNSARLLFNMKPHALTRTLREDGVQYSIIYTDFDRSGTYASHISINVDGIIKEPMHIKVFALPGAKEVSWSYLIKQNSPVPTFVWQPEVWSDCSKTCGLGVRTRMVHCKRSDDKSDVHADNCKSIDNKPAKSEECAKIDCPAKWVFSEWSKCSKECASGTRTRIIDCVKVIASGDSTHTVDGECKEKKPNQPTSEKCNQKACEPKWFVATDFGACSKSCGDGISTRKVICKRKDENGKDNIVPILECEATNMANKPETERKCNQDKICPMWKVEKSTCSKTCGNGIQKVTIRCEEHPSGKILEDSNCTASDRPTIGNNVNCNEGPCPGYKWVTKDGECSKTCENGIMIVAISCVEISTNQVQPNEGNCDANTRPPYKKPCYLRICIRLFEWKTRVSACSKRCGPGTKTTVPYCVRKSDGAEVDNDMCEAELKPDVESQICLLRACRAHEWLLEKGECLPCYVNEPKGTSVQKVFCERLPQRTIVDDSLCTDQKPTPTTTNCTCPEITVEWRLIQSKCSEPCGPGIITQEYKCFDKSKNKEADDELPCLKKRLFKPSIPTTVPCQIKVCPVYEYDVKLGPCNSFCGGGYNIKFVECVNSATNPHTVVDGNICKKLGRKVSSKQTSCKVVAHGKEKKCKIAIPESKLNFYEVGCYKDVESDRTLKDMMRNMRDEINWKYIPGTIKKCYWEARRRHYTWFALQYYGECYGGNEEETKRSYDKYGKSENCWLGVGQEFANYIYHIGSPVVTAATRPLLKLGCFYYKNEKLMEAKDAWNPSRHSQKVKRCALDWLPDWRNGPIFGVDSTGKCLDKTRINHIMKEHRLQLPCPAVQGERMRRFFMYEMLPRK